MATFQYGRQQQSPSFRVPHEIQDLIHEHHVFEENECLYDLEAGKMRRRTSALTSSAASLEMDPRYLNLMIC